MMKHCLQKGRKHKVSEKNIIIRHLKAFLISVIGILLNGFLKVNGTDNYKTCIIFCHFRVIVHSAGLLNVLLNYICLR